MERSSIAGCVFEEGVKVLGADLGNHMVLSRGWLVLEGAHYVSHGDVEGRRW